MIIFHTIEASLTILKLLVEGALPLVYTFKHFTMDKYESDNRWHSFLPDETKPRKMKPIVKRKWEDLEEIIVQFLPLLHAMQFSGHRDVRTYIKHYCFSRYSDEQKRNELEKTLNK